MFGNGKVFISHTHQDNALCDMLAATLDAWQVDYWLDLNQLSAGQELFAYINRALGDRDIFIRVCTPAAQDSPWMDQEETMARSLRAPNRSGRRLIINLLMAPGYQLTEAEKRDVVIDATQMTPGPWIERLRKTLGVPPRGRNLNRRAFIGLGATSVAALGGLGLVGDLLLAPPATPGYRPTTRASKPTPQASASRLLWDFSIAVDQVAYNSSGGLSVGPSGVYVAALDFLLSLSLNGVPRWQNTTFFYPSQTAPTLAGDTLYILAQEGNALLLLAMNAQDGTERWQTILENGDSFYTAPVVAAGNDVVVQYDGATAALDTASHALLWAPQQHAPGANTVVSVPDTDLLATPAVVGGVIYAGLLDGNLYAYDLATGSLQWAFTQFDTGFAPIQSTPMVADGVVYFGRNDGFCYAVDANVGALRWKRQLPGVGASSGVSAITFADGVLYLCAGSSSAQPVAPQADVVFALDAATGQIRWQTHPSQVVGDGQIPAYAMMKQPLFLNGRLYVTGSLAPTSTTRLDELYALDSSDGSVLWRYEALGHGDTTLDGSHFFPSAPVAYNDVIYFVSGATTIYALSTT